MTSGAQRGATVKAVAERKGIRVVISPLRTHTTGSREGGRVLAAILVFSIKELPRVSVNRLVTLNLARHFKINYRKFEIIYCILGKYFQLVVFYEAILIAICVWFCENKV